MADRDVVVVGDILCDEWRYVARNHHNPEHAALCLTSAPDSEVILPGGAGLLALCLQQLGAQVTLFGQVDQTYYGDRVLSVLVDAGVDVTNVTRMRDCRMPVKSRYLNADDHIVVRHDTEYSASNIKPATSFDSVTFVSKATNAACVVVADYDKGYLDGKRHVVVGLAQRLSLPIFVDCKANCIIEYRGATVFKVNQVAALGFAHSLSYVTTNPCKILHKEMQATLSVMTCGATGVSWCFGDCLKHKAYDIRYQVGNAVGAGDAFLAGMVMFFLMSGTLPDIDPVVAKNAMLFAHLTANEKIRSFASELTPSTIVAEYFNYRMQRSPRRKILSHESFAVFSRACVNAGKTVVFTNGCFDVLHAGHLHLLREAKARGDVLVVAVDADANVRRLKGTDRPVQPALTRANVLAAMQIVDAVTVFTDTADNATLRDLIARCKPHYLIKGGDYNPKDCVGWQEITQRKKPGRVVCCSLLRDVSTTKIIKKLRGENV